MKKVVSIISVLTLILSLNVAGYSQSGQEATSASIAMSGINTYRITPLEPKAATAQYINNERTYTDTPIDKMGVGIINATTSWADVPAKVAEVSERDNLFLGVTLGFGEGLVSGVARGVSGVADTATFGVPPYDKPIMAPQYKVENPDKDFKINILSW